MGTAAATINQANALSQWSVTEDLQGDDATAGKTVLADALNPGQKTYKATSTPPGVYYSGKLYPLVAGAVTIDLRALAGVQADIDGNGTKVQRVRFRAKDSLQGAFTISPGAANGYELFGAANSIVIAAANDEILEMGFRDTLADIDATHKEIDIAGTGTDEIYCEFLIG